MSLTDTLRARRTLAATTIALAAGGTALALTAPVAGARTGTLHFYQQSGPARFFDAAGRPIAVNPPASLPATGDRLDETDRLFAGGAAHHAATLTGSDHLACTFTSADAATCDLQIAVGGSMLLGNDVALRFSSSPSTRIPITEGTGAFHGAHGYAVSTNLPRSQNAELVVRVG